MINGGKSPFCYMDKGGLAIIIIRQKSLITYDLQRFKRTRFVRLLL